MTQTTDTVIRHIEMGVHDSDLSEILKIAGDRLYEIRQSRSVSDFGVGDTIEFNPLSEPTYLRGRHAKVVGRGRTKLLVQFDSPTGGFVRHEDGEWKSIAFRVSPYEVDPVV